MPVSDDTFATAEIVDNMIAVWDGMRQNPGPQAGNKRFRSWFFETLPAQAGAQDDSASHAFLAFDVVCGLFDRGRTADAFLLLSWLGRHFVRSSEAARATMALTDTCVERAIDQETNAHAIRVLREVIDSVRTPVDIRVERALCRALSSLADLSGRYTVLDRAKTRELAKLWRELARRCRDSADPELRGWRAHALGNEALLWLQSDREVLARRLFAAITAEFGADRPGVDPDVDLWVSRARHAVGVLDRFDVGEPELKLDYLKRQRYWALRRPFAWDGLVYWLLGEIRGTGMRSLVRHARDKHRWSVGQLRTWLCVGEPFILLLRNFELTERSGISARPYSPNRPDFSGDHVQQISIKRTGLVLNELAAAVPLVGVASTTSGELEMGTAFGQFTAPVRLYLPDKTWFDTVSMLISVADQVIVWAAEFTSGLAQELELLAADRRTDDTLVLLESEPLAAPGQQWLLPRAAGEPMTKDHPALAPFPHIIDAAELADQHLAECPSLMRMLERRDAVCQVPIDQRLAELSARLDARLAGRGA
jgi:hypothetical protein